MMVMVDETTGNRSMRAVSHRGLGSEGDANWLIRDMHQEFESWGHPGGGHNALILKSDGEPANVAVREALARCHGGRVAPEQPPSWGTSGQWSRRGNWETREGQSPSPQFVLEEEDQQRDYKL